MTISIGELTAIIALIGGPAGALGAWLFRAFGTFQERQAANRQARADAIEAQRVAAELEAAQAEEERQARAEVIETYRTEMQRLKERVELLESQVVELRSELHLTTRENERLRAELLAKEAALTVAISERDAALAKLERLTRKATAKKKVKKK